MCEVNFITQFSLIMEYCRENCVHSRERMLMIALFHCANRVAQQSVNHEWPDDYFTISNAELNSWCDLDKRAIETLRNSLRQRGLIDFVKGSRNKSNPSYKINYLHRVGYRIEPMKSGEIECKNAPNSVPNYAPNNVPNNVPNRVPNNDSNNVPLNININTKTDTNNTHTLEQQTKNACARERFNPNDPSDDDTGWKNSNRVRSAVAQRLLDHYLPYLKRGMYVLNDEITFRDNDGIDVLCEAMERGISPKQIDSLANDSDEAWQWFARVKNAAIFHGDAPQKWFDMRWEILNTLSYIEEERQCSN